MRKADDQSKKTSKEVAYVFSDKGAAIYKAHSSSKKEVIVSGEEKQKVAQELKVDGTKDKSVDLHNHPAGSTLKRSGTDKNTDKKGADKHDISGISMSVEGINGGSGSIAAFTDIETGGLVKQGKGNEVEFYGDPNLVELNKYVDQENISKDVSNVTLLQTKAELTHTLMTKAVDEKDVENIAQESSGMSVEYFRDKLKIASNEKKITDSPQKAKVRKLEDTKDYVRKFTDNTFSKAA